VSVFFNELRRRKVYRVAAVYAVVAWLIIQICATVFPVWELPNWSLRLIIVANLAGFPIALIFAWVFDATPSGVQKTETPPSTPATRVRTSLLLLIGLGIVISILAGFFLLPRASAKKIEKSIAVLPFENFSDDKANAYFADGIQDDVLTNLAKISDLKVISRTSVMPYRGRDHNVREIAKALGVSAILEGSVRRAGNRVRVNVQLIDAENDRHLWAEDYDRDLTDVFAIQSDLAHEIAMALQAKLSPTEKAQMETKPTQNADAYLAYMQAHDFFNRPDKWTADLNKAEELFQRAIQLDPSFALAYAQLSHVDSWLFHSSDPSPARREKARTAVNEALRLEPNLPEAHVALGYCYYYGDREYERALAEFAIAQRGLPNDSEVYLAIAAIQRRQGKWQESTENFEKAASLNPSDGTVLQNLATNYAALRRYEAADKIYDRGIAASPNSFGLRGMKAKLAMEWKGDLSYAAKMLKTVPAGFDPGGLVTFSRANVLIMQRRFQEALQVLQQLPGDVVHGESASPIPKGLTEGMIYRFLGDSTKASEAFGRALVIAEKSVGERPDDAGCHALLGGVLAGLGRKEEAIREGKRAVELLPESKDALDGPEMTIALAQIYTWVGEKDLALQLLEHSAAQPAGIMTPMLKLDPIWDPLRDDPRFKQLIAKQNTQSSS
jgi:TolB-like protein/Flp pilus assembly protein TadD